MSTNRTAMVAAAVLGVVLSATAAVTANLLVTAGAESPYGKLTIAPTAPIVATETITAERPEPATTSVGGGASVPTTAESPEPTANVAESTPDQRDEPAGVAIDQENATRDQPTELDRDTEAEGQEGLEPEKDEHDSDEEDEHDEEDDSDEEDDRDEEDDYEREGGDDDD